MPVLEIDMFNPIQNKILEITNKIIYQIDVVVSYILYS